MVKLKADMEVLRVESDAGTLTPTQRTTLEQFSAHANNDGVLDSKEIFQPPFTFVPYLKLATATATTSCRKRVLDFLTMQRKTPDPHRDAHRRGPRASFLDFLDADHDRRISRRELLILADRLAPWCDQKDGSLIVRIFQISIRSSSATAYCGRRTATLAREASSAPTHGCAARCGSARWTATPTATSRGKSSWDGSTIPQARPQRRRLD